RSVHHWHNVVGDAGDRDRRQARRHRPARAAHQGSAAPLRGLHRGPMMQRLPPPRAILFDWDNTLVDTWSTIQPALNAALTAMGFAAWTLEETRVRARKSLRDTYARMFGERWPEARDIFYATYRASHLETLRALPEAERVTRNLAAQGLYLGVVSNK